MNLFQRIQRAVERLNRSPGVVVGGTHTALRNSLSLDEVESEQYRQFAAEDPEREPRAHP